MNVPPFPRAAAASAALDSLNEAQRAAVEHDEGPLLVIAGAGSGKTRTLTHRVARLVAEGIPPAAVLLLTFTRKAAQEMIQRAIRLLDRRCERVSGGTFHSFAHLMLRQHGGAIGLPPDFAILDRSDAEDLIGLIRKEAEKRPARGRLLPRKQTLADLFSRVVNKGRPLEETVLEEHAHFAERMDDLKALFAEYERRKREHHFVDYDDLLVLFRRLLAEVPEVRRRISGAYRHILVDEYQDTNRIQADILDLLADAHRNLMVVGDDSQSVYAFRGADFRNILEFPRRFPGTRVIRLEENYRSTQPILDLTNLVIARAREKHAKRLFTRRDGGTPPLLVEAEDENAQSRWVVDRIRELLAAGTAPGEIAVLFRAGYHSFDLEIELARAQIPFVKVGGFKFSESAHIKDTLAHLRVLANPYDRLSWHRVLTLLERIGPKHAESIYRAIVSARSGVAGLLALPARNEELEKLKALFRALDPQAMPVADLGQEVVRYYLPILRRNFDDHPRRAKDLEQLLGIMERYRRLESFLADMALEPPTLGVEERLVAELEAKDRLVLSTIHSAKGLEWHSVFVIWALDGRFPSLRALADEEEMEEELRLMYVAMTRAREGLYLCYPREVFDRTLGLVLNRPSRFIDRVPRSLLPKCRVDGRGKFQAVTEEDPG